MSAEIQDDSLIDIFNYAIENMKPAEIKKFSEHYFRILESEDVDLDVLLDNSETGFGDESDFHKYLSDYLGYDDEDVEEEEDY